MSTNIKEQLLQLFTEHEGQWLSGQRISEELHCSRTAIWKHIEELRKNGYEVEAVRKKGYRIVSSPSNYDYNGILFGLQTEWLGRELHFYDSIGSTQTEASRLAIEGAPHGTLVVSREQVSGRGRLGRQWQSVAQKGIWMSFVLRPTLALNELPQLTLVVATAICRAIRTVANVDVAIKWPNDLQINGRKFVGILTELQGDADGVRSVIMGTGLNVNQTMDDFPKELQDIATSVYLESGKVTPLVTIIQAVLKEIETSYERYVSEGFAPIREEWLQYSNTIGKEIVATTVARIYRGEAIGITEDGYLLLKQNNGQIEKIVSADISFE